MADATVPMLTTPQEIEQAIQRYRAGDWTGNNLFTLWEAIRTSALNQVSISESDRVPGEDSY